MTKKERIELYIKAYNNFYALDKKLPEPSTKMTIDKDYAGSEKMGDIYMKMDKARATQDCELVTDEELDLYEKYLDELKSVFGE